MTKSITALVFLCALAGCGGGSSAATEQTTTPDTTASNNGVSDSTPPSTTEVTKTQVAADPAPATPVATYDGFSTPESVLYDAAADVYYVSNIDGSPVEADGKAFISKLSPEGQVLELKWIESGKKGVKLNAPKGMAITDGKLFVADLDTVRVFDLKTGKLTKSVKIPKATFLNDVAVGPAGDIWVSDSGIKFTDKGVEPTGTAGVYHLADKGKKAPVLVTTAAGTDWGAPNGLYANDTGIHVVTFGTNELYRIDENTGAKVDVQTLPKGMLDGVVRTNDGSVYASSWESKTIYEMKPGLGFTAKFTGLEAPADIGYDSKRNRILVPQFMGNKVLVFQL